MNLSLSEIAIALAIALLVQWRTSAALFVLWPVSVLIFPTARLNFGFPIYIYDVIAFLLVLSNYSKLRKLRWTATKTPWHYVFAALVLVCGAVWPTVIYGPQPVIYWVALHALTPFAAFAIGALLAVDETLERQRGWFGVGLCVSLILLGLIGILQFGNPLFAKAMSSFFYRDYAADTLAHSDYFAELTATRANGPHGSPNGMGVLAAIGIMLVTPLVRRKWLAYGAIALGLAAVTTSVSRQAFIGLSIGVVAFVALSRSERRTSILLTAGFLLPVLAAVFIASPYSEMVFERFGRWGGGVEQDMAFQARYVDGPERLFESVQDHPGIAFFGTGPDVQKFASNGVDTENREYGFLSIGYALFFFQYGIVGLLAAIWMHGQMFRQLRYVNKVNRPYFGALMCSIFWYYFADNTTNIYEAVGILCFLSFGLVQGSALLAQRDSARRVSKHAHIYKAAAT